MATEYDSPAHLALDSTSTTNLPPVQRTYREAVHRLRSAGYPGLRRVCCDFSDGVLRLHGNVTSYHQKQLAQTIVRDVDGVRRLINDLCVIP